MPYVHGSDRIVSPPASPSNVMTVLDSHSPGAWPLAMRSSKSRRMRSCAAPRTSTSTIPREPPSISTFFRMSKSRAGAPLPEIC